MRPIQKDELYQNLSEFMKSKGVELKGGAYTKGIHAGCSLLADAINMSQTGFELAKAGLDKKLDQVRQVIHESTAPRPSANSRSSRKEPSASSGKRASKKSSATPKKPSQKTAKSRT